MTAELTAALRGRLRNLILGLLTMGLYNGPDARLRDVAVEPSPGLIPGLFDVFVNGKLYRNDLTTNQVPGCLSEIARDRHLIDAIESLVEP